MRERGLIGLLCARAVVPHRERVGRRSGLRHTGDHPRGIETAAEECRNRNIAYHVRSYGFVQPLEHAPFGVSDGRQFSRGQIPIPKRVGASVGIPREGMAGLEFPHSPIWRRGRWDVPEAEVHLHGVPVEVVAGEPDLVQRFQFRRESNSPGFLHDVQRLDAEAVNRQQETSLGFVPDRKGEHSAQAINASWTFFLV